MIRKSIRKRLASAAAAAVMLTASLCPLAGAGTGMLQSLTAYAAPSEFTAEQGAQWARDCARTSWWRDVDSSYGCQCVDLIMAYIGYLRHQDYYFIRGDATDYQYISLPDGFTYIAGGTPRKGDIFVQAAYTHGTGKAGHVGIITDVNGSSVTTAETNYGQQACQAVPRTINDFTGVIRPNFKSAPAVEPPKHGNTANFGEGIYNLVKSRGRRIYELCIPQ